MTNATDHSGSEHLATPVTRRRLLSYGAVLASAAALAACSSNPPASSGTSGSGSGGLGSASGGSGSASGGTTSGSSGSASGGATSGSASAAASGAAPSGSQAATGTLKYGQAGQFATFNPWAQSSGEQGVANQVFSRLVYQTKDGKSVPDLAESWKLSSDGLSMTLTLRDGLKWHDGTPLVAKDFVEMYGYLSNPAMKANSGIQKMTTLFKPVKDVKAPDDHTVVMEFSTPVPYALDILNYWYAVKFPNPKDMHLLQHLPIGTGPFKMTKFVPSQSAEFEPNPYYYVKGEPKVGQFTYFVFGSGSNVVSNLQAGQVNGIQVANAANVKPLQGSSQYTLSTVRLGVWLVQINVSKPPFDKVKVRQALSYAMDRQQFAKAAHFGLEQPATSPFFASAATGYVEDLVHAQAFDLNKAKSLLAEAGVQNLSIKLPVPSAYPNVKTMAQIWQADLAKIGVSMSIHPVTTAKWESLGSGKDPDVDMVPWNVARCLQDGAVFFSANYGFSGGTLQPFGYRNAHLQDLLKKGATETDTAQRKKIYQEANKIVVDQAYNLCTTTFSKTWAWTKAVSGESADLIGNLMLADAGVQQ